MRSKTNECRYIDEKSFKEIHDDNVRFKECFNKYGINSYSNVCEGKFTMIELEFPKDKNEYQKSKEKMINEYLEIHIQNEIKKETEAVILKITEKIRDKYSKQQT